MARFDSHAGTITVAASAPQLARLEADLAHVRDGAKRALSAAINDTLRSGRTQLTRRMREHLNLKAGDVRDRIQITKRPSGTDLEGVLRLDYQAVRLQLFRPRASKKGGVIVTTTKADVGQRFRHYFSARMASGHVGVFRRVPGSPKVRPQRGRYAGAMFKRGPKKGQAILRQQIQETFGPSVLAAFEKAPNLADEALAELGETFEARLNSKIQWLLGMTPAPAVAA